MLRYLDQVNQLIISSCCFQVPWGMVLCGKLKNFIGHWRFWARLDSYHTMGFKFTAHTQQSVQWLGCGLHDRWTVFRLPAGVRGVTLLRNAYTGCSPTQPHIRFVSGTLSLEVKQSEHEADRSHNPVSRVWMNGAILPLLYVPLWHPQRQVVSWS